MSTPSYPPEICPPEGWRKTPAAPAKVVLTAPPNGPGGGTGGAVDTIWKTPSARVMTTAYVNPASPGAVHDGITLVVGDSILLTGQGAAGATAAAFNRICIYNGPTVPLTLRPDCAYDKPMAGAMVQVAQGTLGSDTTWECTTNNPIDGTTALNWVKVLPAVSPFYARLTAENTGYVAIPTGTWKFVKLKLDAAGAWVDDGGEIGGPFITAIPQLLDDYSGPAGSYAGMAIYPGMRVIMWNSPRAQTFEFYPLGNADDTHSGLVSADPYIYQQTMGDGNKHFQRDVIVDRLLEVNADHGTDADGGFYLRNGPITGSGPGTVISATPYQTTTTSGFYQAYVHLGHVRNAPTSETSSGWVSYFPWDNRGTTPTNKSGVNLIVTGSICLSKVMYLCDANSSNFAKTIITQELPAGGANLQCSVTASGTTAGWKLGGNLSQSYFEIGGGAGSPGTMVYKVNGRTGQTGTQGGLQFEGGIWVAGVFTGGGGGSLPPDATYGDITVSGTGLNWQINANTVGPDELMSTSVIPGTYNLTTITVDQDGRITAASNWNATALSVIGRSVNSAGVADNIAAAADFQVLRRSGVTLGFGTVDTGGITDNAVTNAKLRDSAALSVIGRSADTVGDPADIVAANDFEVLRRSGATVGFGTVDTAGITDDAVTYAKMQEMSGPSLLLGRGSDLGAGPVEEISLGSGLEMVGEVLDTVGFTGTLGG